MIYPTIDYAKQEIKVTLDKDLHTLYNSERYRLVTCKAMKHPHGECAKYNKKIKGLIQYVGLVQFERNLLK